MSKKKETSFVVASEDSPKFHERMRQAMTVSFHKYGPIKDAYPHKVNAIKSLKDRLRLYEKTGNADYLVDIANFAMIEFELPLHEDFHDKPKDGGEGRIWHGGSRPSHSNNRAD